MAFFSGWNEFLRNLQRSTGHQAQKDGWKPINVTDSFKNWLPTDPVIMYLVRPPAEDMTNKPMCRPLPSSRPAQSYSRALLPITALDFSESYGTLVSASQDNSQPQVWDVYSTEPGWT
ncbi:hypothetical protein DFH07DRAFT_989645 [Mycena maculata]|uniref:Uncharacterized protein n=1 Tax=Mycena maculata TaxID=230809 RepID=A0AAD7I3C6_9AGAR|nr:hypothetical protein DFH07DRAFT_989645 [Mycena maculata]